MHNLSNLCKPMHNLPNLSIHMQQLIKLTLPQFSFKSIQSLSADRQVSRYRGKRSWMLRQLADYQEIQSGVRSVDKANK